MSLFSALPLHHILGGSGRHLHDGSLTFACRSDRARYGLRCRGVFARVLESGSVRFHSAQ
ncbi:hypothetical protein BIV23_23985 [Streptomyces monashensis]|uniref:Uncharacterized protein n=1 Tax=Streptomyces monashensis TaxID=1678012 RepID=A0A1S2Q9S2_9ACTN|nr:hypothetical protein BIV23_23985 [Streptomyces monashensis]